MHIDLIEAQNQDILGFLFLKDLFFYRFDGDLF